MTAPLTVRELQALAIGNGVRITADVLPRDRRTALPFIRGAIRYRVAGGTETGRSVVAATIIRACPGARWGSAAGRPWADVYIPRPLDRKV